MQAIFRRMVVGLGAVSALTTFGAATYAVDPTDAKTYVVTVPKGESCEIAEAAATLLNGNAYTNFVKRGEGTLVANRALASYDGQVVVEDGIYQTVPTSRPGLQVNMNGDFISIHALAPGHYDFKLPFRATVTNLKTGQVADEALASLPLDLVAGETRWYAIRLP